RSCVTECRAAPGTGPGYSSETRQRRCGCEKTKSRKKQKMPALALWELLKGIFEGVQVLSGNNHELSFQNNMLHYILALPFMQFGI
ncbi:hypothetical protein, partial [Thiolapillus sp.]|uniref:hypothetical protein n=1 Tax=Thiolapillus sp. TaxID=2017437 RepID=UPI003AF77E8A